MAGNPRLSKNITFNDGTYCHIGQFNINLNMADCITSTGQSIPSVACFDRNTAPSTRLLLSKVASDAIANKFDDWNVHAYAVDDMLETGARSDADWWVDFKEILNDSVQWLWGDLEGGGLGIFTTGLDYNNGVYFIATYGVYQNDDEVPYEKICSYVTNIPMTIANLTECALCYEYNESNDVASDYIHFLCLPSGTCHSYLLSGYEAGFGKYVYTVDEFANFGVVLTNYYFSVLGASWIPKMCVERNDTSYGSIACPISKELVIEGYTKDHGDINNADTYNPNDDGGITTPDTPDGEFDNNTDDVDNNNVEEYAVDAVSCGFVTLYNPNQGNIQAFTDFLFTGITESISVVLKRLISNPLDYVIGLNVVHYNPRQRTASERIKFCGIDSGVSAPTLHQFQTIDCGDMDIDEQFNSFLDYGGYSKAKLVLPYCGVYPLEMNEIQSSVMNVKYNIDNLTGACVAQVKITRKLRNHVIGDPMLNSVMYEYTGNVFSSVPLSAVDYRGTIQGLMQIASGASQVAQGSGAGLGQIASGVMNLSPSVQHSGNMSTSYGYLGRQKPVLILERPMQALANQFGDREGFVSNIYVPKMNNLRGYNEIDIESFHSEYIKCTDQERAEIVNLLAGGVII